MMHGGQELFQQSKNNHEGLLQLATKSTTLAITFILASQKPVMADIGNPPFEDLISQECVIEGISDPSESEFQNWYMVEPLENELNAEQERILKEVCELLVKALGINGYRIEVARRYTNINNDRRAAGIHLYNRNIALIENTDFTTLIHEFIHAMLSGRNDMIPYIYEYIFGRECITTVLQSHIVDEKLGGSDMWNCIRDRTPGLRNYSARYYNPNPLSEKYKNLADELELVQSRIDEIFGNHIFIRNPEVNEELFNLHQRLNDIRFQMNAELDLDVIYFREVITVMVDAANQIRFQSENPGYESNKEFYRVMFRVAFVMEVLSIQSNIVDPDSRVNTMINIENLFTEVKELYQEYQIAGDW